MRRTSRQPRRTLAVRPHLFAWITVAAWSAATLTAQYAGDRVDLDPAGVGVNSSSRPVMALSGNGTAHVAWQDHRSGAFQIHHRSRTGIGGLFAPAETVLSAASGDATAPSIASAGTHVAVAYKVQTATQQEVHVAISANDGGTWTSFQATTAPLLRWVTPPDVAVDAAGTTTVAWAQDDGEVDSLHVASYAGGALTASHVLSNTPGTRARLPRVAAARSGRVNVAYVVETPYAILDELHVASSRDGGLTFPNGRHEIVNTTGQTVYQLAIAAEQGGAVHVAWARTDGSGLSNVLTARNTKYGRDGFWDLLDSPVAPPTAFRFAPDVWIDDGGRTYMTWCVADLPVGGPFASTTHVGHIDAGATTFQLGPQLSPPTIGGQKNLPPNPRPKIAGDDTVDDVVAVTWMQYDTAVATHPRIHLAHTRDAGVTWTSAPIDPSPLPYSARAAYPSLVVTQTLAGVAFDDRRAWETGGQPDGRGAPEAHLAPIALP